MANTWDKAAHNLSIYKPSLFLRQKKILLLPGLVSDAINVLSNMLMKMFYRWLISCVQNVDLQKMH